MSDTPDDTTVPGPDELTPDQSTPPDGPQGPDQPAPDADPVAEPLPEIVEGGIGEGGD